MNKKLAIESVDFADSEYIGFQMSDDSNLTIFMKNWKEEPIKIIFNNTIQFSYNLGDTPKDLYVLDKTCFLEKALNTKYNAVPSNHPYKHFQIEDIDDFPFIQVIAESVTIVKK